MENQVEFAIYIDGRQQPGTYSSKILAEQKKDELNRAYRFQSLIEVVPVTTDGKQVLLG